MAESIVVRNMKDQTFHIRSLKHVLQPEGSDPVEIGGMYLVGFPKSINYNCEIIKIGSLAECTALVGQLTAHSSASSGSKRIRDEATSEASAPKKHSPALSRKVIEKISSKSSGPSSKFTASTILKAINPKLSTSAAASSSEKQGLRLNII
jgi:hypothetical protein